MSIASNKINNIFNNLKNSEYKGGMYYKHLSVVIRNNIVISPILCNYNRSYVFGKTRGTLHAEMNSLNYIINNDKSSCCRINHRTHTMQPKGSNKGSNKGVQCKVANKGLQIKVS